MFRMTLFHIIECERSKDPVAPVFCLLFEKNSLYPLVFTVNIVLIPWRNGSAVDSRVYYSVIKRLRVQLPSGSLQSFCFESATGLTKAVEGKAFAIVYFMTMYVLFAIVCHIPCSCLSKASIAEKTVKSQTSQTSIVFPRCCK